MYIILFLLSQLKVKTVLNGASVVIIFSDIACHFLSA